MSLITGKNHLLKRCQSDRPSEGLGWETGGRAWEAGQAGVEKPILQPGLLTTCRQRQILMLGNRVPTLAPDTWVAPNAVVVGDVDLYEKASVGAGHGLTGQQQQTVSCGGCRKSSTEGAPTAAPACRADRAAGGMTAA